MIKELQRGPGEPRLGGPERGSQSHGPVSWVVRGPLCAIGSEGLQELAAGEAGHMWSDHKSRALFPSLLIHFVLPTGDLDPHLRLNGHA